MKTRYIIAIVASLASCIACQKNDIGTVYAVGDSIVRLITKPASTASLCVPFPTNPSV